MIYGTGLVVFLSVRCCVSRVLRNDVVEKNIGKTGRECRWNQFVHKICSHC